ncbi:MAG: hypothetical protein B7Y41_13835 [Hydrogenophilales bacterium 28-61-23]|nr:MAG: hypothetical protein B7Y41_13835 [Hydrogenophilales bacterium 28-61-23]
MQNPATVDLLAGDDDQSLEMASCEAQAELSSKDIKALDEFLCDFQQADDDLELRHFFGLNAQEFDA